MFLVRFIEIWLFAAAYVEMLGEKNTVCLLKVLLN
jgi:hypothetical protein